MFLLPENIPWQHTHYGTSNEVDINIHPRKEEVKFFHPRRVEQALQQAVKDTLEKNLSQHLKKDVTIKSATSFIPPRDFNSFNFDAIFTKQTLHPLIHLTISLKIN